MRYYVITPEYERYREPPELGRDVVEVEAEGKRAARVKGLQKLRETYSRYLDLHSDENPFKGLQVEPAEAEA